MAPEIYRMNSGVKPKGVNIREKGVQKILAEAWPSFLVEKRAVDQIAFGLVENLDNHFAGARDRHFNEQTFAFNGSIRAV